MASLLPGKFKEHLVLDRQEIADRLRHLADQIGQGTISLGSVQATVPERAEYEVELEVNHQKRELEIEVKWR